ncbi:MAG: hypothetical protein KGK07_14225 [Chloroflexota bacterium]|nr:hypothetical protein [Chloroflexota bacterium]
MEPQTFRTLFLGKAGVLFAVGFVAWLLYASPVSATWSGTMWVALGVAALVALALYFARAWRQAAVRLDGDGITTGAGAASRTWPYGRLRHIGRTGAFRVRLCFGAEHAGDPHDHLGLDVVRADAFTEELLDWYAYTQGRELEPAEHDQLAA